MFHLVSTLCIPSHFWTEAWFGLASVFYRQHLLWHRSPVTQSLSTSGVSQAARSRPVAMVQAKARVLCPSRLRASFSRVPHTRAHTKCRVQASASSKVATFGEGKQASIALAAAVMTSFSFFDRTGAMARAFATSSLISAACGVLAIPILKAVEAGQFVRREGPQAHLSKSGTPTMGGCFFVPCGVMVACVMAQWSLGVIALSIATLLYAAVGFVDDRMILVKKNNRGIPPQLKFALQVAVGMAYLVWLKCNSAPAAFQNIPVIMGLTVPVGVAFWPLALFTLTAESNGVNLTDGLDGLAAGTCAAAFAGMGIAILQQGCNSIAVFCACMAGACIGFLAHNSHKARVFMGDTGSLALGGSIAMVGVATNSLLVLFVTTFIFAMESLSVMAQVLYFKHTKKSTGEGRRIFRMAPFHHHLELGGWPAPPSGLQETRVVSVFYVLSVLLAALGVLCGYWIQ